MTIRNPDMPNPNPKVYSEIYHVSEEAFLRSVNRTAKSLQFPQDYDLVALVPTNKTDLAFQLTNSILNPWYNNATIITFNDQPKRSTSVNDVIRLPDGRTLRYAQIGMEEL